MVRLIRSDLKLNIFGEIFPVPPELKLEYVVATINVKEQKLKLFLDKTQVEEFELQATLNNRVSTMSWHENLSTMSWHSTSNYQRAHE